jgi:hypothetical protein
MQVIAINGTDVTKLTAVKLNTVIQNAARKEETGRFSVTFLLSAEAFSVYTEILAYTVRRCLLNQPRHILRRCPPWSEVLVQSCINFGKKWIILNACVLSGSTHSIAT